jgi:hypothetical protein
MPIRQAQVSRRPTSPLPSLDAHLHLTAVELLYGNDPPILPPILRRSSHHLRARTGNTGWGPDNPRRMRRQKRQARGQPHEQPSKKRNNTDSPSRDAQLDLSSTSAAGTDRLQVPARDYEVKGDIKAKGRRLLAMQLPTERRRSTREIGVVHLTCIPGCGGIRKHPGTNITILEESYI